MNTGGVSDLDRAVADIKARLAAAQRVHARAEGERDAAAAAAATARAALSAEFGVDDVQSARTMLDTLQADLATQVAALSAALNDIEH